MEPIERNNYYEIFQTALLIALEEFNTKQALIADICGISAGYLSKLKAWNVNRGNGALQAKRHVINTNFRKYAVPLKAFLEQEYQVGFADGYFATESVGNSEGKKWGNFTSMSIQKPQPNPEYSSVPFELFTDLEIPESGELAIEWSINTSNPTDLETVLKKIQRLAEIATAQMTVKIVLRKNLKNNKINDSNSDYFPHKLSNAANKSPYLNFRVEPGGSNFSEFISFQDTNRGVRQEQFCDYSDWEQLHRRGSWQLFSNTRSIQGQGMFQYLLSQYSYGTQPFSLHAVLAFNHYAPYAQSDTEKANAGIILGWQNIEGRNQYYHLLLDGETMCLEQVGAMNGDHYSDFRHLHAGVPFIIEEDIQYEFWLCITSDQLVVYVDNKLLCQFPKPSGMVGRVGIRPWRATVTCSYFKIEEVACGIPGAGALLSA